MDQKTIKLFVEVKGKSKEISVRVGQSLRDEIKRANLPLIGECDSAMICSTCHVVLNEAWGNTQQARSEEEQDLLETLPDYQVGSRLACQTIVEEQHDGLALVFF